MPAKPKPECWQTAAPPETLLQQSAFMESCTAWLVEQRASLPIETFECRATPPEEKGGDRRGGGRGAPALCYTPLELRVTSRAQPCFFCGARGDEAMSAVMANPFAQRHFVLICGACRA